MLERIRAVEENIDALKMTTSIQADKIKQLENWLCSLEDAKEKHERDKRAKNIVIQGLPIQNKTKEDTREGVIKDLLQS